MTACTYLYINHHFHIHKNILLLQFYMHLYASVTAGTVCPAAIYVVRTIYNPTNNVVPIKYVNKIPNHIYNPPINVCLQNLFYQFSLLAAIHLFISSHNEIKDFCSMDKKTGRRYVRCLPVSTINIQFYREKARKYINNLRGYFDEMRRKLNF